MCSLTARPILQLLRSRSASRQSSFSSVPQKPIDGFLSHVTRHARQAGMTATRRGPLAGTAALLVWGEIPADRTNCLDGLNNWWTNEHLPERLALPGFHRARRYAHRDQSSGEQHYLTLYEVDSPKTLTSEAYLAKLNAPTSGTQKYLPLLSGMKRAGCDVLGSYVRLELEDCGGVTGGHLLMLETAIQPDESRVSEVKEAIVSSFRQMAQAKQAHLCCHLLLEDREATAAGSGSQSYRGLELDEGEYGVGDVRLILLVEGTESLERYGSALAAVLEAEEGRQGEVEGRAWELMCSVGR